MFGNSGLGVVVEVSETGGTTVVEPVVEDVVPASVVVVVVVGSYTLVGEVDAAAYGVGRVVVE